MNWSILVCFLFPKIISMSEGEYPGPTKRRKGNDLYISQEVWAQGMDRRKLMCQLQGFPAPNPLFQRELRGLAISTEQLWCASASCKKHPCKSPTRQPWWEGPDLASSHYFCLQITTNFTEVTFWVEAVIPKEKIDVGFLYMHII